MRAFGLEEEIAGVPVKSEEEAADDERFEVWPENETTVEVFSALATQWHWVGLDGEAIRTGINYGAIPTVRSAFGIGKKDWPELFRNLRAMELAALKALREARERNRNTGG